MKILYMSLVLVMLTTLAIADTTVIAHRGFSSIAPENTVAAVKRAAEMNPAPGYIEIDLHRSQDGVLVVCHDENTLRTTGRDWRIREHPFSALRGLDAGYAAKFQGKFENEPLPRLEDVLDVVKGKPIGIMIECKQLLLEDQVIQILRERDELEKHVIASFDELSVYRANQLDPTVKTLYLNSNLNPTSIWRARDVQADIIGTNLKQKTTYLDAAKEAGFDVWVWTVDDPKEVKRWVNAGADGIISNKPDMVLKTVAE